MPELPEVETIKRGLSKFIIKKKLTKTTILCAKSFVGAPVTGTVKAIRRFGKALIIDLDNGKSLMIHLRMTGQLIYDGKERFAAGHPSDNFIDELPNKQTRVVLEFDSGSLFFNDQRKFGFIKVIDTNKVEQDKFFEDVKKIAGVESSETGLCYLIKEPGNDVKPGPQDTVLVRYKGSLLNGTVFDEVPASEEPIRLTLDRVIPGWTEGLQLIGEGGKAVLYIPSELGYGSRGSGSIEPNSTLVFDVELVKVFPYADPKIDLEN